MFPNFRPGDLLTADVLNRLTDEVRRRLGLGGGSGVATRSDALLGTQSAWHSTPTLKLVRANGDWEQGTTAGIDDDVQSAPCVEVRYRSLGVSGGAGNVYYASPVELRVYHVTPDDPPTDRDFWAVRNPTSGRWESITAATTEPVLSYEGGVETDPFCDCRRCAETASIGACTACGNAPETYYLAADGTEFGGVFALKHVSGCEWETEITWDYFGEDEKWVLDITGTGVGEVHLTHGAVEYRNIFPWDCRCGNKLRLFEAHTLGHDVRLEIPCQVCVTGADTGQTCTACDATPKFWRIRPVTVANAICDNCQAPWPSQGIVLEQFSQGGCGWSFGYDVAPHIPQSEPDRACCVASTYPQEWTLIHNSFAEYWQLLFQFPHEPIDGQGVYQYTVEWRTNGSEVVGDGEHTFDCLNGGTLGLYLGEQAGYAYGRELCNWPDVLTLEPA